MQNLNSIQLIGFVGADPTTKNVTEKFKVASFSVATTESYTDKEGKKHESTQWHNLEVHNSLADIVEKFVKKGSLIHITGKLTYAKYTKPGTDVEMTLSKIIASDIILLDRKPSEAPADQ